MGQGVLGMWWIAAGPAATGGASASTLVKTATAKMLVNAQGLTLYVLTTDKKNKSTCTGQCASFWPPLLVPSGTTAPTTVTGIKGTFGVAPGAGGAKQLTFNGSPLYTFIKDKKPGDMTGLGVLGTWWIVVAPAQSSVGASASPSPTPRAGY
jgi:predicted lipoprotein with Yx(FWY)xxD motif